MAAEGVEIGVGKCLYETDAAIKVVIDGKDADPMWIPKSQIHEDSEVFEDGGEGVIVVSAWFAKKSGLGE